MFNVDKLWHNFKRDLILKVGGFNTKLKFNEDKELGDRLAKTDIKLLDC